MNSPSTIFQDFNLPNATTWFYFSLLLAMALFFKFSRLFCLRNWDVVALFLVVPGLLLIQGARAMEPAIARELAEDQVVLAVDVVAQSAAMAGGVPVVPGAVLAPALQRHSQTPSDIDWIWLGYLCVLLGTGYFFVRCLIDLALVQRPALAPNLNFGGLAWLAGALFFCLVAVAFRQPDSGQLALPQPFAAVPPTPATVGPAAPVGPESAPFALARQSTTTSWLPRMLAVLCHLLVVAGLVVVGWVHFQDAPGGMAAATFYLVLPYTGLFVGQAHHVWPMALVVWAVVAYRMPTVAGAFLGIAAATAYFPALVLPLWFSFYWRRGATRFLLAALASAIFCLVLVGLVLWLHGGLANSLHEAFHYGAWQPWQGPPVGTEGFWTGIHWAYRIPVFIAYLSFVLVTPFWPMPKNLAQVIALSAAVFIGIQFWYANQGGVYVLWYLPLLLLLVFRPNLEERRPPVAESDWLARSIGAVARFISQLLGHRDSLTSRSAVSRPQ